MYSFDHADAAGIAAGTAAGIPAILLWLVAQAVPGEMGMQDLLPLVGSGGGVAILALTVLVVREVRSLAQAIQTWRPVVRIQILQDDAEITGIRPRPEMPSDPARTEWAERGPR